MKRLFLLMLMFTVLTLNAQKHPFWQKVNEKLTTIKNIDTTYIYHPKLGFTLGIFSTMQKAGFNMKVNFKINLDEDNMLTASTEYDLKANLSTKLGLEIAYGKIGFGYGFEVGPKQAYKKRALAFNILGKAWGLHFNYFKITNQFQSSITIGKKDETNYIHDVIIPKEPATMRRLSIDAYYVFNNKRFAYPAAYKTGLVQRRTAGSWMVTGRYLQGSIYNSPESSLNSYNLLDCFSTLQVSLGGGYSGNIVCWHKDPIKAKDKGLRNITINITALPVLTVVTYMKTTAYQFDDDLKLTGEKKSKMFCYPMPNFIGSAALGITLDRFFLSAQFNYNWIFFLSSSAYNPKKMQIPDYVDDISFRGSFHDWTLKLLFSYKF